MPDSRSGESYSVHRAAVEARLGAYRKNLGRLGLMDSPYVDRDRNRAWLSGYDAALRDLAERPEVVDDA